MAIGTHENWIIAVFVVLAIGAFYVLSGFTNLHDWAVYAVVLVVGVLIPGWLTRPNAE